MSDLDTNDIIFLHSHTNVCLSISFQVFDFPSRKYSNMFTRVLELVPGEDVHLSIYNDPLKF